MSARLKKRGAGFPLLATSGWSLLGGDLSLFRLDRRRTTSRNPHDQTDEEKGKKDHEENLCNSRRGGCNAAEPEDRGNDGDHQKRQSPTQHDFTLFRCAAVRAAGFNFFLHNERGRAGPGSTDSS